MDLFVVSHKNMVWKIKEFLKNSGYTKYSVITRYPTEDEKNTSVLPLVACQIGGAINYDKELSTEPGEAVDYIIDIFASTQSQLDSVVYAIMKNIKRENFLLFYDMSILEPTIIGDYSGLSSLGLSEVMSTSFRKDQIVGYTSDKREIYNAFIITNLKLPIL